MSTLIPSFEDVALAKETSRQLAEVPNVETASLRMEISGKMIALPAKLTELLREAVGNMAKGRGIAVIPIEEEITPREAAELLNVSRPFASRLFDQGVFPSRRVGTHRRALATDVLAYKEQQKAARLKVLDELAAEGQSLGI